MVICKYQHGPVVLKLCSLEDSAKLKWFFFPPKKSKLYQHAVPGVDIFSQLNSLLEDNKIPYICTDGTQPTGGIIIGGVRRTKNISQNRSCNHGTKNIMLELTAIKLTTGCYHRNALDVAVKIINFKKSRLLMWAHTGSVLLTSLILQVVISTKDTNSNYRARSACPFSWTQFRTKRIHFSIKFGNLKIARFSDIFTKINGIDDT